MERPNGSPRTADGFEGAVAGLGLADVIQMNGLNRFTGSVVVECDGRTGSIFFRDGAIVHAEAGVKTGEQAFYEIMQWPGGKFSQQPKSTTATQSIDRHWQYLLMEAHRLIDEERREKTGEAKLRENSTTGIPSAAAAERLAQLAEEIRKVSGVACVVMQGRDGSRAGDSGKPAETLEGEAAYLAGLGKRLGTIFRTGDLTGATVQGSKWSLLLRVSKAFQLNVQAQSAQAASVDAEIRKILTARR